MAASETALGALHNQLTKVLSGALDGFKTPSYIDPETGEEVEGEVIPPSASIMTVAAKFLKDNEITCAPSEDNALGELEAKMKLREQQRSLPAARQVLDEVDLAGIRDDAKHQVPN